MRSLRFVAAIGDIHQEHILLESVLDFIASIGPDAIVAVGDIVDGPGDGARCCELLAEAQVDLVRGNHDRWFLEEAAKRPQAERDACGIESFLSKQPVTRQYKTGRGQLLLCHGLAENDMNRLIPDDYGYALATNDELQGLLSSQEFRFVINGHTHQRMVRDFDGVTVINVGTLLRGHSPCFAIVDFEAGTVTFYDIDVDTQRIAEASTHAL